METCIHSHATKCYNPIFTALVAIEEGSGLYRQALGEMKKPNSFVYSISKNTVVTSILSAKEKSIVSSICVQPPDHPIQLLDFPVEQKLITQDAYLALV